MQIFHGAYGVWFNSQLCQASKTKEDVVANRTQVVHEIARLHNAELTVESTKGVSWVQPQIPLVEKGGSVDDFLLLDQTLEIIWQSSIWKMDPLKMYFLLKMVIFHCYISLPEGIPPCFFLCFACFFSAWSPKRRLGGHTVIRRQHWIFAAPTPWGTNDNETAEWLGIPQMVVIVREEPWSIGIIYSHYICI